jgi:hypothetical protein
MVSVLDELTSSNTAEDHLLMRKRKRFHQPMLDRRDRNHGGAWFENNCTESNNHIVIG